MFLLISERILQHKLELSSSIFSVRDRFDACLCDPELESAT